VTSDSSPLLGLLVGMDPSDQHQLAARRTEWVSIVNAGDLPGYVQLVGENVLWLPPAQPPIEGRKAFEAWLRPFFERFDYEFVIEDPDVRLSGDWAVETGAFDTVMTGEDGMPTRHGGEYLVFWHRESDGIWYLERYLDQTLSDRHQTSSDNR